MADLYIVKAFLNCDSRFGSTAFISGNTEDCLDYIKRSLSDTSKRWDYYSLYEAGQDQQDAQSITYINKLDSPIDTWHRESVQ